MNNLPSGWQNQNLIGLCDIVRGSSPRPKDDLRYYGGDVPRLMVADLTRDGMYVTPQIDYLTVEGAKQSREMKAGDVVIAVSGNPGLAAILNIDAFIHDGFVGLRNLDKTKIHNEYLYHYLSYLKRENKAQAVGAIFKNLRTDQIKNWKIPLPPLPIQKQIAEILEKADQAKQKRKEANRLTEQFLQSAFIEMFGDPVKNPNRWESEKFENLGKLARGKSKHRPRNAPFLLGGKYPLIQTGEIVNSFIYIKNFAQTYSEEGLKQSRLWPKGTLCISIAANIGFTAILNFEACFPDSIVGFTPNANVLSEYIHFYFRLIQKRLEDDAPQSAQKNINLEILNKLKVSVPPLPLQQQFADLVQKTEALKEKQKQSEQELENLFNSLMQKAFKGELVS